MIAKPAAVHAALAAAALLAAVLAAATALAAPALAAPARAQDVITIFGSSGPVRATSIETSFTGALVVSFHGDPGSGCASRGLCSYSGVVIWRPQQGYGSLDIQKGRDHGRTTYTATLYASSDPFVGPQVSAQVRHTVPGQATGTCADVSSASSYSTLPVRGSLLTLAAFGDESSLLSTRCAGPLGVDVAPSLPTRVISIPLALRGHRNVDLAGAGSFAAGGFAGTVTSTLVLHLGDVYGSTPSSPSRPGGRRLRLVTEPLTLLRTAGAIAAQVRPSAEPGICALLDSCGVRGAITIQPQPSRGQGALTAFGPASRPYRDFLAALGLSRAGNPRGISVIGGIGWDSGGTLQSDLLQSGACRDTTPLGSGNVSFAPAANGITAVYTAVDSLRVRCPGPALTAALGRNGLASTDLPVRVLGQRRFAATIRATRALSDQGYTIRLTGALRLTIECGRPSERFIRLSG